MKFEDITEYELNMMRGHGIQILMYQNKTRHEATLETCLMFIKARGCKIVSRIDEVEVLRYLTTKPAYYSGERPYVELVQLFFDFIKLHEIEIVRDPSLEPFWIDPRIIS